MEPQETYKWRIFYRDKQTGKCRMTGKIRTELMAYLLLGLMWATDPSCIYEVRRMDEEMPARVKTN